jgi:hypothetical protein
MAAGLLAAMKMAFVRPSLTLGSTLAGLKARIGLVDDVDAPLAPDNLVVPVARAQGFQGVTNFHDRLWVRVWAGS